MFDLCEPNKYGPSRYVLGKSGTRKLFAIGLNPSTANKEKSDVTVSKVERVAENKGYNGFVMLNLYPIRSTNPKELGDSKNEREFNKNIKEIVEIAKTEKEPHFWTAWGNNISLRSYLLEALRDIFSVSKVINAKWFHLGELTKKGNPRHPSRLSYEWDLREFNIASYLAREKR